MKPETHKEQEIYKIVNGSIIKGTATYVGGGVLTKWEDYKNTIFGSQPSAPQNKEIYFSYEEAERARIKLIKKEVPAFFLIWLVFSIFLLAITNLWWPSIIIALLGAVGATIYEIKHKDNQIGDIWETRNYPEYPDYPDSGGC